MGYLVVGGRREGKRDSQKGDSTHLDSPLPLTEAVHISLFNVAVSALPNMVWYGMVWCGVVWCGVVWCSVCQCYPWLELC